MASAVFFLDLWCLRSLACIPVSEVVSPYATLFAHFAIFHAPAPGGPMRIMRTPCDGAPPPPPKLPSSSAIRPSSFEMRPLSSSTTCSVIGAILLGYVEENEKRSMKIGSSMVREGWWRRNGVGEK
jgi:hypothetical protein